MLGDFKIIPIRNVVINKDATIHLEPKIMDVCHYLARNYDMVISREQLINAVWDSDGGSDESLTRAISKLRKIFKTSSKNKVIIETIPKRGYRLANNVMPVDDNMEKLPNNKKRRLADKLTKSREAYNLYLQGRALNDRIFGKDVLEQAAKDLNQAVNLDLDFAEAWAELSKVYLRMSFYNKHDDWQTTLHKSEQAAKKAINLKPLYGAPTSLLSWGMLTKGDFLGALRLAEKAYHIDPNYPDTILNLGILLAIIGRTNDAIALLQKAVYIDPTQGHNHMMLSTALLNKNNISAANDHAQRAKDLKFDAPFITYHLAAYAAGDSPSAIARCIEDADKIESLYLSDNLFSPDIWAKIAMAVYAGNDKQSLSILDKIHKLAEQEQELCSIEYLSTLILSGSAHKYFKIFKQCGSPISYITLMHLWLPIAPMNIIRQDPEFMDFAKRIGLHDAWGQYGYPDCWNGKSFKISNLDS